MKFKAGELPQSAYSRGMWRYAHSKNHRAYHALPDPEWVRQSLIWRERLGLKVEIMA